MFPGPFGGLRLLLNIEMYEHMKGPNMDSGVKVSRLIYCITNCFSLI